MKHLLDFSLVPDLRAISAFHRLPTQLEGALRTFRETFDRAWGALHFSFAVTLDRERLLCPPEDEKRAREANLRASLAEFVGMEAALLRDLRALHVADEAIKIHDTANPLPHVIKELRNLELHLHSSTMSVGQSKALIPDLTDRSRLLEIDHDLWYIDNLTAQKLSALDNARHYRREQIDELVRWFNAAQRVWGVNELVRLAVEEFAGRIVTAYPQTTTGTTTEGSHGA